MAPRHRKAEVGWNASQRLLAPWHHPPWVRQVREASGVRQESNCAAVTETQGILVPEIGRG